MSPNADELIGHIMGGYKLVSIIGRGGTSIVFLGQKEEPPYDQVAVKVLMPPLQLSTTELQEVRKRFSREALTLSERLQHKHILPVLASGEDKQTNYAFIITPYIQGGTLARRIPPEGMPLIKVIEYITQIAEALDYAHAQNVIHRDMKPANILIDENDHLYLADFGIVKLFDTNLTTLTELGRVIGTPEYMAPEQAQGDPITPATDVYGLAVLTYTLVTGRYPYPSAPIARMLVQVINKPPIPPRTFRAGLPEAAEAALLRGLNKVPAARFPSAGMFATAFARGVEGQWFSATEVEQFSPSAPHIPEIATTRLPIFSPSRPPVPSPAQKVQTTHQLPERPVVQPNRSRSRLIAMIILIVLIIAGAIFLLTSGILPNLSPSLQHLPLQTTPIYATPSLRVPTPTTQRQPALHSSSQTPTLFLQHTPVQPKQRFTPSPISILPHPLPTPSPIILPTPPEPTPLPFPGNPHPEPDPQPTIINQP